MKTFSELWTTLKANYPSTILNFVFPTTYILVISSDFKEITEENRLGIVADVCGIKPSCIESIINNNSAEVLAITPSELETDFSFLQNSSINNHWLSIYNQDFKKNIRLQNSNGRKVVHFYGQKGGQARSSVVAATARSLADEGHKVLVIDADIEAPTLHTIFGIEELLIEHTLMGHAGWALAPSYTSNPTIPGVHFIGCRPSDSIWEMDYATFTLRCSLDPQTLVNVFEELSSPQSGLDDFDIVLIDHRTGAANSVIPIITTLPGPCLVFSRPDNQTTWMEGIKTLFSFNPESPGAFISFSLDNMKKHGDTTESEGEQKEKFLEILADAIAAGADDPEPLPADELERYYVQWVYDRAFFNSSLPKISQLQTENIYALNQLKEILGISRPPEKVEPFKLAEDNRTSASGIVDETWFVESETARAVLQKDSNLNYIFGRKGTGKSRLFKESIERGVGLPLLSPSEYEAVDPNIPNSSQTYVYELINKCEEDYRVFWWLLLAARLDSDSSSALYKSKLEEYAKLSYSELKDQGTPGNVSEKLKSRRVTLLIDGLETAVPSMNLLRFVESILQCMNLVQNSSEFRQHLNIRLFLRVDLAIGSQNIEQQTFKRKIDLHWSEQAQMNYVLACIAANKWVAQAFPEEMEILNKNKKDICLGTLPTEACEEIILRIFPEKLRRSNIKTITFIKTYFRDASSQTNEHLATFYPRLFLKFTLSLFEKLNLAAAPIDSMGRIEQAAFFDSYDKAANDFINEARQELSHAISLDPDPSTNATKIRSFLENLRGKPTPFSLENLVKTIHSDMDLPEAKVKTALQTMKDMGFFETTPKDSTRWRAGRVYKSALHMKFVRR
jgi:Mrp family chromosome partitioning ATPase